MKRWILGVCGSISAYKSPLIVRELLARGCQVRVLMTESARQFVSPLVLQNLSQFAVPFQMFDPSQQSHGSWHIEWAHWAQGMLVAPASANCLARLSQGVAEDPVSLVGLSLPSTTPLLLAPATDSTMWANPAVQRNVRQLLQDGRLIHPPDSGPLASGHVGPGRLPEPSALVGWALSRSGPLSDQTVLITAGPTRERIDQVRYLSNFSSGKQGYALAQQAQELGAKVILVSGPVELPAPPGVELVRVESAQEMLEAVQARFACCQLAIFCAAVADFRPADCHAGKLKKEDCGPQLSLNLVRNPDILAWAGQHKGPQQTVVGFALEAQDAARHAEDKLRRKNCDWLVLNEVFQQEAGLGAEANRVSLLSRTGQWHHFETQSKRDCARSILETIMGQSESRQELPEKDFQN